MPYRCLGEFLEDLGRAGELARVDEELDPALQAAEFALEAAKAGGPALLLGTIKGHDIPVVCNLLATDARICRALGVASLDEIAGRIARLLNAAAPESWFERLKGGAQPAGPAGFAPRKVKSAAVQQIVRLGGDINLGELPLLQAAPEETGGALTAVTGISAEPDSHRPVAARFNAQRLDRTRLAVCWADCDEHARLLGEYRTRERKMPLAIVLGGDPGFLLATASPLPPGSDVCAMAGMLREKSLDIVTCRGIDLDVPAEAEIVLEGFVDPAQPTAVAGPFCGPTGHCTAPRSAPVMQVTAVTHRANPVYALMVPGPPPHEATTVARAMQRIFLPLTQLAMPELVDYDLPEFAAARLWAAVSIKKTYAGQGRRAAHAAWALPAMRFAKVMIVVDGDVDVHDYQQVMAAVATNVRPARDVVIDHGPPDPFDPAMSAETLGQKMAIDATRKVAPE